MSKNRIIWAVLTDHDKTDGKVAIIQRVLVAEGRTILDARIAIEELYPTAQFITWVSTFKSIYNGQSDLHVE